MVEMLWIWFVYRLSVGGVFDRRGEYCLGGGCETALELKWGNPPLMLDADMLAIT